MTFALLNYYITSRGQKHIHQQTNNCCTHILPTKIMHVINGYQWSPNHNVTVLNTTYNKYF